jgi:hypothetical protein
MIEWLRQTVRTLIQRIGGLGQAQTRNVPPVSQAGRRTPGTVEPITVRENATGTVTPEVTDSEILAMGRNGTIIKTSRQDQHRFVLLPGQRGYVSPTSIIGALSTSDGLITNLQGPAERTDTIKRDSRLVTRAAEADTPSPGAQPDEESTRQENGAVEQSHTREDVAVTARVDDSSVRIEGRGHSSDPPDYMAFSEGVGGCALRECVDWEGPFYRRFLQR